MAQGTAVAEDRRARATARYVRMTPMKVRRVVDLIRGMEAREAMFVLHFAPQAASETVAKVLASAVANAENNANLKVDGLVVKEATVGEGPTLKRIMARARGSASQILKRTSHIRIVLSDEIAIETRATRKAKRQAEKKAEKKEVAGEATQGAATAPDQKSAKPKRAPKTKKQSQ